MADSFDAVWDSIEVAPAASDTAPAATDSFDAMWDSIPAAGPRTALDDAAYIGQKGVKGAVSAATLPWSIAGLVEKIPPFSWASQAGSALASKLSGVSAEERAARDDKFSLPAEAQALAEAVTGKAVDSSEVSALPRYTGAIAEALPSAAYGGGILPAVAAGIGGQGGKDIAKSMGAGPKAELIAEISGAIAGGSIPAAASSVARGSVKAITGERTAEEAAKALRNKAIGGRLSDFIRNAKKDYFDPLLGSTDEVAGTIKGAADSSLIETQLSKNIDEVISSGTFEKGAKTPKALYQANRGKMQEIGQSADAIVKKADEALGQIRIYPKKFEYAEAYIRSNRVPLEDKPRLLKMLNEAKQRYKSSIYDSYSDAGALSVWQKEKQALQNVAYKDDKNREILEKYLGADIRKFVEEVADQVTEPGALKAINAQYAKHASVDPILERNAIGTEVATQGAKELMAQATTGGTRTGPSMRGAAAGASSGAILGAPFGASGLGAGIGGLLGLGTGYARGKMLEYVNSPGGQFALADFLSAMSSGSKKNELELLGKLFGPGLTKSAAQSAAIGANMGDSKKKVVSTEEPEADPMPTPTKQKESPITEATLDAVRWVESKNGKYKKSPAGAMGEYQFMPATAKAYNVDPTDDDPTDDRAGARALLQDELKALGSLELALAAYNAGRPAVTRAIKKAGSKEWAKVAKYLPEETRLYVPKVLDARSTFA